MSRISVPSAPRRHRTGRLIATLVVAGALAACSGSVRTGTVSVSYGATAEKNYKKGTKSLKDKSYEEATKYFKFVRARYPFSKYATLAELRIADVLREEEKFIAAIDAYKNFAKDHPTHYRVENGYAAYNVAYCYWRMTPSDFFILPPAYEKDQTSTEAAMSAFKKFLENDGYRRSPYRKKAKKYYKRALRRLSEHEMYVARFYLRKDKPKGTILRLEYLIKKYPGAGLDPEVMFLLGKTYLRLKKPKKALTVFKTLKRKYAKNYNARKAQRYITFITKEFGLR